MTYRNFIPDKKPRSLADLAALLSGLKQLLDTPITSLLLILTFTLSLFLAMTFYILDKNVEELSEQWNESTMISLYLKKNTTHQAAQILLEQLQSNPNVAKIKLITPDEGMKNFTANSSLNLLLSNFKNNPLPNVIVIHPKIAMLSKERLLELTQELKNHHEVELIKADDSWIEQSYNLVNLWHNSSSVFVLALILNTLLVIGGISYTATKAFQVISNDSKLLPYQFAWCGLISNLLALIVVKLTMISMQNWGVFLSGFHYSQGVLIIFMSICLSFISSKIAVRRR